MPAKHFVSFFLLALLLATALPAAETEDPDNAPSADEKVSYYEHIRPIFQAHCQGCHQPAKADGDYVMTSFEQLLAGGESEEVAVVAGEPSSSNLIAQILPSDGEVQMPQDKDPLAESDIKLITRWIQEGAVDDTPDSAVAKYDMEHPPVYTRPPVITAIDFSPDGKLLAVSGFHEVFLLAADGSAQLGRLVGLSDRIESVHFSPDGQRLAVVGGLPGRMGEVQIWDVPKRELLLSVPTTFDTIYGGAWSPDGKLIAYGAADKSVRALEAETGKEVVFMAAHDDWIRDTVFSKDGQSIFSASRDKTVKKTDVATQRFVGNVTTTTPGVLLGGMIAISRHPYRNEILVGGADGAPKLFRMSTKAALATGGNPNQIREFEALPGRVFAVCFSPGGAHCFAGSSLDGKGQVCGFETDTGKQLWELDWPETGIFALAISPDGKRLASAGADGVVRMIDPKTGQVAGSFTPVELAQGELKETQDESSEVALVSLEETEDVGADAEVLTLSVEPGEIVIDLPVDKVQLLVTAGLSNNTVKDVTRDVEWSVEGGVGSVSSSGLFVPNEDGTGQVIAELSGQRIKIPVEVRDMHTPYLRNFIRDVNPVLGKLGCNSGTCHGGRIGQNGFKLSLRGYDAIYDIRGFTDDLASRRVNFASPDDSLMLLKTIAAVPHEGGQLMKFGDPYYTILRDWIAAGAKLDPSTPRVTGIEVLPKNPVIQRAGQTQQLRVVATYADGKTRDVTHEAFVNSGDTEVATVDDAGLVTAVRRGESPALVRYEGAYAATILTVMGDRSGFEWTSPETWGRVDELVSEKWERMQIEPSLLCSDTEFLRRIYLDMTGLPPKPEDVRAFMADSRDVRIKRTELIDKLIGSEGFVEYWTNKWADLLQVNGKFLGPEGAVAFREWIRGEVDGNTPYDEFARKIILASGSNGDNPAASYFKILREPDLVMENTTHLFLALRFNCNKCHDHPFERWTQDQYYQTAAYFAHVDLQPDPERGNEKLGGTAVEDAKPRYEVVSDKTEGEVEHVRTGKVMTPGFPYECDYDVPEGASRRQQIAAWLTSPANRYFAHSYVNRLWGYLFGVGIIEPIDDIRAGNPPTNPELLNYLADEFIRSNFDVRHVMQLICTSRTYQLSVATNRWNEDDGLNYSHAIARRLPAEVLYDALHSVTGSVSKIPGLADGTRAAAIPDAGITVPDGFLSNMGRPARESACECERVGDMHLGGVIAIVGGPTVGNAIADPDNELTRLVSEEQDDPRLINEIFLRILNRPATEEEISSCQQLFTDLPLSHEHLLEQLKSVTAEAQARQAKLLVVRQAKLKEAEATLASPKVQKVVAHEKKLDAQHQEKLVLAEAALKKFDKDSTKLKNWEKELGSASKSWQVLHPSEFKAANGATLELQDDQSIFVSGENGRGAYEVVTETPVEDITGVRLEVIADERLPSGGPGRAENGNFVLSELELFAAPNSNLANWDLVRSWDFGDAAVANVWLPQEGAKVTRSGGMLNVSGEAPQVETTLTNWSSVGPFFDKEAFNAVLGPEGSQIDPQQTFREKGNRLAWQRRLDLPDGRVHTYSSSDDSATYFYRKIKTSAARKMILRFGSDEGIKAWLNGAEVFTKNVDRKAAADQELIPVMLKKGENELMVKIVNAEGPSSFYFATDSVPAINPSVATDTEGGAGSYAVEVVAKADGPAPARIFWKAAKDDPYSGRRVTEVTPLGKDGDWNTYRFDFISYDDLSGLRFDPAGASVAIKEVRLYRHELPRKVAFNKEGAKADYSNEYFTVKRAIDGKAQDDDDGWASDPDLGETRLASFQTQDKISFKGGVKLRFLMDQQYLTSKHSIGRFRLSVTQQEDVRYGIPPELVEVVETPVDKRSDEQREQLKKFHKKDSIERKGLLAVLNKAKVPREGDKELETLRYRIALLKQPISEDHQLVELKRAIDLSTKQLENQRLTVAQDIAWALINNPAFLFNH